MSSGRRGAGPVHDRSVPATVPGGGLQASGAGARAAATAAGRAAAHHPQAQRQRESPAQLQVGFLVLGAGIAAGGGLLEYLFTKYPSSSL